MSEISTPPRAPRALTCVELTEMARLRLDQLATDHRSGTMRVVILDAIDLLYSLVYQTEPSYAAMGRSILHSYEKEQTNE